MFEHQSTLKQIQANRLNAQKSTGPVSLEGKAAAAMNALQSGIHAESHVIPGEDAADLHTLAAEYHDRFHPATPEQRFLVDNLVHYEWLLRRFRTIEAHLAASYLEIDPHTQYRYPLSHIYDHAYQQFGRLQWRINSVDRLYHHTLAALQRLQSAQPESAPESEPPLAARPLGSGPIESTTSPEIGFVPQPGIGLPACPPAPPVDRPSPAAPATLTERNAARTGRRLGTPHLPPSPAAENFS